jgi:hypothetical protein
VHDRSATQLEIPAQRSGGGFIDQNVPADGYILEIPSSLYAFLSGRKQAAKLDYFSVIDSRLWDETREIEHIKQNNPQYALVRTDMGWQLDWHRNFPHLERYLGETFAPHAQFGPVQVLRRREAQLGTRRSRHRREEASGGGRR